MIYVVESKLTEQINSIIEALGVSRGKTRVDISVIYTRCMILHECTHLWQYKNSDLTLGHLDIIIDEERKTFSASISKDVRNSFEEGAVSFTKKTITKFSDMDEYLVNGISTVFHLLIDYSRENNLKKRIKISETIALEIETLGLRVNHGVV